MQEIMDKFAKHNIAIGGVERLYIVPECGGLGLIKVSEFITPLKCNWQCWAKLLRKVTIISYHL
jgi:hypothetical protein